MLVKTFTLKCPTRFHARPASVLISEADRFKSQIIIRYKDREINASSIIGVMTLAAEKGDSIQVIVSGEDEEEAMESMEKFFLEDI